MIQFCKQRWGILQFSSIVLETFDAIPNHFYYISPYPNPLVPLFQAKTKTTSRYVKLFHCGDDGT